MAISNGWRSGSVWSCHNNATPDTNRELPPVLRAAGQHRRRQPGAEAAPEVRRGAPQARQRRRQGQSRARRRRLRACPGAAPSGAPRIRCRRPTARSSAIRAPRCWNRQRNCGRLRQDDGRAGWAWSAQPGTDREPIRVCRNASGSRPTSQGRREPPPAATPSGSSRHRTRPRSTFGRT